MADRLSDIYTQQSPSFSSRGLLVCVTLTARKGTQVRTLKLKTSTSTRWLKRDGGGNEIENFLKNAPFENYSLFLGAEKLKGGVRLFRQMSRRKVGSGGSFPLFACLPRRRPTCLAPPAVSTSPTGVFNRCTYIFSISLPYGVCLHRLQRTTYVGLCRYRGRLLVVSALVYPLLASPILGSKGQTKWASSYTNNYKYTPTTPPHLGRA